jgi:hypothetical protein
MSNLRTPGINNAMANTQGPVLVKNDLKSTSELKVRIVTSANGAKTNLLILPGPCPVFMGTRLSCTVPEQTEVVLTSSVNTVGNAAGYAEFVKYIAAVGMYVSYVRFTTTTTSIYDGSLFMGELPPNGYPVPEEIPLNTYASVLGGGGYDKTLLIKDKPFANTDNFYMYLSSMPASATLDIAFGITGTSSTFAAEKVG